MPGLPLPLFHLFPAQAEAAATVRHGGNQTTFNGRTLKDSRELNAHLARLFREQRRADDEALVLLLCA